MIVAALALAFAGVTAETQDLDLAVPLAKPPRRVDVSERTLFALETTVPLVRTGILRSAAVSFGQPAVDEQRGVVIVGTGEGEVRAIRLRDGEVEWTYVHGEPFEGAVTLVDIPEGPAQTRAAVLGSRDGTLLAIDLGSGRKLWSADVTGDVRAPVVRDGDLLLVQTAQNQLLALDLATGKSRWTAGRPAPTRLTVAGHARPLVAQGSVYATFSDGYAEAYSLADGGRLWSRPLSLKGGDFIDADADPQLRRGRLFVGSYSDGVFALDPRDGHTLWSRSGPAVRSLALDDDRLIVGSGDGWVWGLSQADGSAKFRTRLEAGFATRFTVADDLIVFAAGDSGLVVLDSLTGRPIQASGYRVRFHGDAAWSGQTVAMISASGHLYVFRRQAPPKETPNLLGSLVSGFLTGLFGEVASR